MEKYKPFYQVYGVCFNDEGKILIQKLGDSEWSLPGGTVEENESPIATLKREFLEETDVSIKNPVLLGGQRVQFLNGHHSDSKRGGDDFYQLRHYCEVDTILPQTP